MSAVLATPTVATRIAEIPDPEIPVVTIADLGILRDVRLDEETRTVEVTITPTYSGCPAMDAIERAIRYAAARAGWTANVTTRLSPAWSTDWISEAGRRALHDFGIAPPPPLASHGTGSADGSESAHAPGAVAVPLLVRQVTCPRCGSTDTEEIARFGSTACKALRRCRACAEPFDEFKAL